MNQGYIGTRTRLVRLGPLATPAPLAALALQDSLLDGGKGTRGGVARGQVAQLGGVLGAQGGEAGVDGAPCDLAPRTLRLGDQRPEVLVDASALAVAAPGDGGGDLIDPRTDRDCGAPGDDLHAAG